MTVGTIKRQGLFAPDRRNPPLERNRNISRARATLDDGAA
jgi:hypothetical protein